MKSARLYSVAIWALWTLMGACAPREPLHLRIETKSYDDKSKAVTEVELRRTSSWSSVASCLAGAFLTCSSTELSSKDGARVNDAVASTTKNDDENNSRLLRWDLSADLTEVSVVAVDEGKASSPKIFPVPASLRVSDWTLEGEGESRVLKVAWDPPERTGNPLCEAGLFESCSDWNETYFVQAQSFDANGQALKTNLDRLDWSDKASEPSASTRYNVDPGVHSIEVCLSENHTTETNVLIVQFMSSRCVRREIP